jgi:hypothetical protein
MQDKVFVLVNPKTKEILRGPFPSLRGARLAKAAEVGVQIGNE